MTSKTTKTVKAPLVADAPVLAQPDLSAASAPPALRPSSGGKPRSRKAGEGAEAAQEGQASDAALQASPAGVDAGVDPQGAPQLVAAVDSAVTGPAPSFTATSPVLPQAPASSGAAADSPILSGWTQAMMSVDRIPVSAVLGGGAALALVGAGGGAAADTTPPAAPTISTASASIHVAKPSITGTAEANSLILVYDGTNLLGSTTASSTGQFSFTPTTALSEAAHSITVKAMDAAGNVSGASSAITLTVDTTPPVAPVARLDGSWVVNPQVTLSIAQGTASAQNVVVELYPNATPVTVANWLAYVNADFYNGLIFHRVTQQSTAGFSIVQGGGYDSNLNAKAALYDPIVLETGVPGLSNVTGTIAMARTSVANSATSQFYFNDSNNTFFDYSSASNPGYAVFGKVVSGMSTVDAIDAVATSTVKGMANVPTSTVTLQDVSVTDAGLAYSSSGRIFLSGLETGAQWSYSLDSGASWIALPQSEIDLPSTAGPRTVWVRQVDAAGNASAVTSLAFTQYVAGSSTSVLDLATASDTTGGTAGTDQDNVTASTSLSLSATLAAWANREVWLMDNGQKAATATGDSSGALAWQVNGSSTGDHVFTLYDPQHQVRVVDGAGIAASELLVRVI